MDEMTTHRLGEAAALHTFTDPSFKTMRVSVNLFVPLTRETAARNAILPSLVSRATQEYPDYTVLSCRLAELYGASLSNHVRKMGEYQVLTLSASGISSRYAFGGEDMFAQLTGLLFSVLFHPLRDGDGLFPEEGFLQERRQLLELLDSEYNDKITYAHQRCEELLFEGRRAGLGRCGSRQEVEALDRRAVSAGWEELLSQAQIHVFALGDCRPDPQAFRQRFAALGTPQPTGLVPFEMPAQVRRVVEEQPVAQSKLSMGFRVDYTPSELMALRLMAVVLGGTPSSKLFQNVREKQSLCYYCSAGFGSGNRSMFIESGVETANLQRAEEAILQQLEAVRRGEITHDELLSAKLAIENGLRSVRDSLSATEGAYLAQCFTGQFRSPEEEIRQLMAVTADQVAEMAGRVHLAAVYTLKGSGSHGQAH